MLLTHLIHLPSILFFSLSLQAVCLPRKRTRFFVCLIPNLSHLRWWPVHRATCSIWANRIQTLHLLREQKTNPSTCSRKTVYIRGQTTPTCFKQKCLSKVIAVLAYQAVLIRLKLLTNAVQCIINMLAVSKRAHIIAASICGSWYCQWLARKNSRA